MSATPRRADPEARRALLARLLAEEAERPLREPATPGQKRLWFAMRGAPGSPVYNCPLVIDARGELVAEALELALQVLVDRHEALRTRFEEVDGELYQVVAPRGRLDVERHAPAGESRDARRAAARAFARSFATRGFDLTRGPLYRVALVTLAAEENLLLLSAHHLVSDGWSQGVLLREWLAAYRAFVEEAPLDLPSQPIRYLDAARWQREGEPSADALDYWKEALASAEPLRLPLDFARPPLQTTAGARIPIQLSAEATAHARAVAERESASLFQVVLAAFQMVLALWCRQERFVVGTPTHNRHRTELEGLVGFFVSTVPIVAELSGEPTMGEAFDRLRQSGLQALAHADVSFDRLVALAPRGRAPGVPPLVQVLFVWQQGVLPELDLPGARLRAHEEPTGTSKFDLTLSLRPEGDALVGHLELNTDLFAPTTLRRMLRQLEPVLEALHRRRDAPLRTALSAVEAPTARGAELSGRTDTASAYAQVVGRRPKELAIWTKARSLTYAELDAAAAALVARLRALGQRDGEPLTLRLGPSVEALVGIVAAWKCASPYVPLDPDWPAERVRRIVEETGARLCLAADDGARVRGATTLAVDLDRLLHCGAPRERAGVLAARPEDLAYIIYTSGSTGAPKGVLVPHRALAHLDAALESSLYGSHTEGGRRIGVFGSLAFDTTVKQIVRLLRGDCLCPVPRELKASPARLVRYLDTAALDAVDVTPSWMRVLLDAGLEPNGSRTFLLGGEPIAPALWHELALRQSRGEARFLNLYGPTEATVDATWAALDADREPSIGRPLPDTRVWLLDEQGRPVPPGFAGEIAIGGGGVAIGYLNRPEVTAAAFTELRVGASTERVYRTGDFARLRDDDQLAFLGRRDRQVKRHGQRIELGEIEGALCSHPAVTEAAVVSNAGKLVAWYVKRGETLGDRDLAEHAARILPPGLLPDAYRECSSLPHTTSGKIDYVALAALSPAELPVAPASHGATGNDRLDAVVEIWTELLGSPPASPRADFFAAGGDSLLGLRLLARVEKRFGVALDVALLASSPTPERLAAALSGAAESAHPPFVWLRRAERASQPPLALVHPTSGEVACYRDLVSLLEPRLPVGGLRAPREIPEDFSALAAVHTQALLHVVRELARPELLVGGWSLGGVLALEVARELRRHGVTVPLVLLLDSRLPSALSVSEPPPGRIDLDETLGAELATEDVSRRLAAQSVRLLALWERHHPEPYDGDVLLVRARSSDEDDAETARWQKLVPRLGIVRSALEHDTMMRPPDVGKVAQIVSRSLKDIALAPRSDVGPSRHRGQGVSP